MDRSQSPLAVSVVAIHALMKDMVIVACFFICHAIVPHATINNCPKVCLVSEYHSIIVLV